MFYLIIILACYLASVIGSICGIGGGVIIKPVLDATGIMPVTTISFLSGCTVLSMSGVSLYSHLKCRNQRKFDKHFATVIALGGVAGGLAGKEMYQAVIRNLSDTGQVGAIQAMVLLFLTGGTLVYTIFKDRIPTKKITCKGVIFIVGILLGIMSSFLGIGGGPINLIVLFYLFSMTTKQAAVYSIYVILFSQTASIISVFIQNKVPSFSMTVLVLMCVCGILGGLTGARLNRRLTDKTVDKLFMGLMAVIIIICVYNIFKYI